MGTESSALFYDSFGGYNVYSSNPIKLLVANSMVQDYCPNFSTKVVYFRLLHALRTSLDLYMTIDNRMFSITSFQQDLLSCFTSSFRLAVNVVVVSGCEALIIVLRRLPALHNY